MAIPPAASVYRLGQASSDAVRARPLEAAEVVLRISADACSIGIRFQEPDTREGIPVPPGVRLRSDEAVEDLARAVDGEFFAPLGTDYDLCVDGTPVLRIAGARSYVEGTHVIASCPAELVRRRSETDAKKVAPAGAWVHPT